MRAALSILAWIAALYAAVWLVLFVLVIAGSVLAVVVGAVVAPAGLQAPPPEHLSTYPQAQPRKYKDLRL